MHRQLFKIHTFLVTSYTYVHAFQLLSYSMSFTFYLFLLRLPPYKTAYGLPPTYRHGIKENPSLPYNRSHWPHTADLW